MLTTGINVPGLSHPGISRLKWPILSIFNGYALGHCIFFVLICPISFLFMPPLELFDPLISDVSGICRSNFHYGIEIAFPSLIKAIKYLHLRGKYGTAIFKR
ncbi:MAG: hypothetical protein A2277_12560 [Desulfobacterales bacterium RIFOXYA12_FULL_46_15]|nr:MAG: hypothetical protein A2277_12560 [Desulfobacterales bacterium RIFOXYA12_FULL_46_15]